MEGSGTLLWIVVRDFADVRSFSLNLAGASAVGNVTSLAKVPEPAPLLLVGAGLAGIGSFRPRR